MSERYIPLPHMAADDDCDLLESAHHASAPDHGSDSLVLQQEFHPAVCTLAACCCSSHVEEWTLHHAGGDAEIALRRFRHSGGCDSSCETAAWSENIASITGAMVTSCWKRSRRVPIVLMYIAGAWFIIGAVLLFAYDPAGYIMLTIGGVFAGLGLLRFLVMLKEYHCGGSVLYGYLTLYTDHASQSMTGTRIRSLVMPLYKRNARVDSAPLLGQVEKLAVHIVARARKIRGAD